MNKILAITGVTGKKSGGAFAKLICENWPIINEMFPDGVRALVRKNSDKALISKNMPNVELFPGDITDSQEMETFLENVDTLVHIAGVSFSEKLVIAAVKCKVRRLILVHTTGIYSKYKAAGEAYRKIEEKVYALCKENGIILSICRPTMIYGNPFDNNVIVFIKMVDKYPMMPIVGNARYALQPVHYEDLAKAYLSILLNEEKTANKDYVLSGDSPIELREMLKVIGKNLGKKVHFIRCPFVIAYLGAVALYCLTFGKKDYREKVQRLCEHRAYSHEEASNDFGYSPISFHEGIVNEVQQYLAQKDAK